MIYEYLCNNSECSRAGIVEEVIKPVADIDRPEPCEICQTPRWRKVSLSSFQLKGGNWARDKYGG
jgi:predicted nucleic acid-binding Zn ribbon protein